MTPDAPVTTDLLREFAEVDVATDEPRYRVPLERDLATLASTLEPDTPVVLLGSVATGKYVDVIAPVMGSRLLYPRSFVGRGDMSRGGLLLRSVASGEELDYVPLTSGVRPRGARPAKLDPLPRKREAPPA